MNGVGEDCTIKDECATGIVLGIAKLTHKAEYAFGILNWLGNRTFCVNLVMFPGR